MEKSGLTALTVRRDRAAYDMEDDDVYMERSESAPTGRNGGASWRVWRPVYRCVIGCIGLLGLGLSVYLTVGHYREEEGSSCPTGGCNTVTTGPYSHIMSVPLSSLGALAYLVVIALSLGAFPCVPTVWRVPPKKDVNMTGTGDTNGSDSRAERVNRVLLLVVIASMATFSSYLMLLMYGVIHEICPWCLTSAVCCFSMFVIAVCTRLVPQYTKMVTIVLSTMLVIALGAWGVYQVQRHQERVALGLHGPSTDDAMALAEHLRDEGVTMYGSHYCGHCLEQKEEFGKDAFKVIDYVECAPDQKDSQSKKCQDKGLTGLPAWEIDGKILYGDRSLSELARLTKFILPSQRAGQIQQQRDEKPAAAAAPAAAAPAADAPAAAAPAAPVSPAQAERQNQGGLWAGELMDRKGLAERVALQLASIGSVMYGSNHCGHCKDQKKDFGESFEHLSRNGGWVECSTMIRGHNANLCKKKQIQSYPTWEIFGKFFRGRKPMQQLATLAGLETIDELRERGVTLYTSSDASCEPCAEQKKMLGTAGNEAIHIIECPPSSRSNGDDDSVAVAAAGDKSGPLDRKKQRRRLQQHDEPDEPDDDPCVKVSGHSLPVWEFPLTPVASSEPRLLDGPLSLEQLQKHLSDTD